MEFIEPVERLLRAFGGDKVAKSIWGKLSGYSRRALVETTFPRDKKMFGERALYSFHFKRKRFCEARRF